MADNDAGLARLETLVARLTPADLALALPAGWTVAGILCHLAFWDLRAAEIVRRTAAEGPSPSPVDTDLVNEAMRPLLLAVPPDEAVRLVVAAAEAAAAAVAAAPDELLESIASMGGNFWPRRSRHWNMHLDEVDRALEAAGRSDRAM